MKITLDLVRDLVENIENLNALSEAATEWIALKEDKADKETLDDARQVLEDEIYDAKAYVGWLDTHLAELGA